MNLRIRIAAWLLALVTGCVSKNKEYNSENDSIIHMVVVDSSFIKNKDKSPLEAFIDTHADSINNSKTKEDLPQFLKEPQFDYHYAAMSSFHKPLPLRKLIIDKVINCNSLKWIQEDKSGMYRVTPQQQHGISVEFLNLSFNDLVESRLSNLNCK